MQSQFDRKPKRVSAWQMPTFSAQGVWPPWEEVPHPGWLQDALQKRILKVESFPSMENYVMRAQLPGKRVVYCFPGGWVACDDAGNIGVITPEELAENWDRAPE